MKNNYYRMRFCTKAESSTKAAKYWQRKILDEFNVPIMGGAKEMEALYHDLKAIEAKEKEMKQKK